MYCEPTQYCETSFRLLFNGNGAHLTLALLANNAPELVEIGIATDAIFAVIIMVVLVNKIYRTFNTVDAKQLMSLKG